MRPLRVLGWLALTLALAALPACSGGGNPGGESYGKYTLFATKYDNVDLAKAQNNATDVLNQLQDKDDVCLIGLWAYNPPAILNAVKKAGRQGKVKIVGFDEMEPTLKGIEDGHIHATVVQNPY